MLRVIRTIIALLSITAVTLLFVDFTGLAAEHWGWIAKWQFVPALLSLNIVALAVILILTFLFGRIYCSVICPLGIMQDVISRLRITFSPRLRRKIGVFRYRKPLNGLRYGILGAFAFMIILALANLISGTIASFVEPYSAYGRIASGLFAPVWDWANNFLADEAAAHDSYAFYTVYRVTSMAITVVGAVTLVVVGIFAAVGGRLYCNTVCPVGTTLGLISRHAIFKPVINHDACVACHACERHCKAGCIDSANKAIDLSRCVACMDCIDACREKAISFAIRPAKGKQVVRTPRKAAEDAHKSEKPAGKTNDSSKISVEESIAGKRGATSNENVSAGRRNFVTALGVLTGAAVATAVESAAEKFGDGGLTPVLNRKPVKRISRIVPAGSVSHAHVSQHCIGCQLCIQNCPNGVLKPSMDPETFMQPVMDFTEGYCTPECTRCADVCPAGVFHPIDVVLKSSTKIGTAVVDVDTCIAATQGVDCGNCERHCPTGAVVVYWATEDENDNRSIPVVDENACIGCGACESHCPVGNVASTKSNHAAIHVEGLSVHRNI